MISLCNFSRADSTETDCKIKMIYDFPTMEFILLLHSEAQYFDKFESIGIFFSITTFSLISVNKTKAYVFIYNSKKTFVIYNSVHIQTLVYCKKTFFY